MLSHQFPNTVNLSSEMRSIIQRLTCQAQHIQPCLSDEGLATHTLLTGIPEAFSIPDLLLHVTHYHSFVKGQNGEDISMETILAQQTRHGGTKNGQRPK